MTIGVGVGVGGVGPAVGDGLGVGAGAGVGADPDGNCDSSRLGPPPHAENSSTLKMTNNHLPEIPNIRFVLNRLTSKIRLDFSNKFNVKAMVFLTV